GRPHENRAGIEESLPDPGPLFVWAEPLEREAAHLANFQEKMLEVGNEAFREQSLLKLHLGFAVLSGLKRNGDSAGIIDGTDDSDTPYDRILAASLALSRVIKTRTSKDRVAILLPPGRAGFVANIAVLLANKVPVNLNFTASKDAVDSAIKQADLDLFITADAFRQKMTRFAWPDDEQLLYIEKALPKIKWKIAFWLVLTRFLSAERLASMISLPKTGGDKEAVLLFTSGSSGEPKGVGLTHVNVLANVMQFGSRLNLSQTDRLLGCLPLFHSFGCTVTMWFPLVEGFTTVTFPNPIETRKLGELIEKYRVTVVLGTPTFLRGYLRKATAEQFAHVKLVVAGAEKLPAAVSEAFKEKLGPEVLEGYGLTETSPVTNVNLPDPVPDSDPAVPVIPCLRRGSVGQLLPGVAVRITHPDTELPVPVHDTGMIWLSGANIFRGYLNAPEKTADVIQGQWFKTGDIGRLDEDGFLYIEGRLSRFSKIGGEMVPHETVESYLNNALEFGSSDERKLAVTGIPDEAKGEALVMLVTEKELDFESLRKHLISEGVPALWVPKKWLYVESIPTLASGKLDIRGCQDLAAEA
ncbi:MAG: acyl-[acyl-carrier-protein]-phospholipid O-acyltransferase, partial [Verrucomicrobiales bacterium]